MEQDRTASRREQRQEAFRRGLHRDAATGWIMTADLLSGVLAWGGIGWLLDHWLDTGPWLLAVGIALGFALGTYLVIRRADAGEQGQDRDG